MRAPERVPAVGDLVRVVGGYGAADGEYHNIKEGTICEVVRVDTDGDDIEVFCKPLDDAAAVWRWGSEIEPVEVPRSTDIVDVEEYLNA